MTVDASDDCTTGFSNDDPRKALAKWANGSDEWVRYLVGRVLSSGARLIDDDIAYSYQLFRQASGLDPRVLPAEPDLAVDASRDEVTVPLRLTKLSEVSGVNALAPGGIIEPHEGLTVLYGENGTGKTGYARIFKALAGSRTRDEILGDISADEVRPVSATVEYALGDDSQEMRWSGDVGVAPFTSISVFDSPAVTFHVDDDLDYTYTPAALALFGHVVDGVRHLQRLVGAARADLTSDAPSLIARFSRDHSVYGAIESLGATTDLETLKSKAVSDSKADDKVAELQATIGALQSNAIAMALTSLQRHHRVILQAGKLRDALADFKATEYNAAVEQLASQKAALEAFRTAFFAAADLPTEPEDTWEAFVRSGAQYREHLFDLGVHDDRRCLYCRQQLSGASLLLVARYQDYLMDQIGVDIEATQEAIRDLLAAVLEAMNDQVHPFITELEEVQERPAFFACVRSVDEAYMAIQSAVNSGNPVDTALVTNLPSLAAAVTSAGDAVAVAQKQIENRDTILADKRTELADLHAGIELAKSWAEIETRVLRAKEADKLAMLEKALPRTTRALTELAKSASDILINQSFDSLFAEECEALRAPSLKVDFIGREGKAKRRKVLSGSHRPSKVLSEGEQKVLAMSDFLAEARLGGFGAPVIFDDPVSSLDHRRIGEVSDRIAALAAQTQVIVFTHDVMFAAELLSRFEQTKRCRFYQVTDDGGKGRINLATGPRWDSISELAKRVNASIFSAEKEDGEARDAHVRTGYGWLRSWCEVFTEQELLQGVTQRYQPNVRMTTLTKINVSELAEAGEVTFRVFEDACRYIDSHSQPLPSLGVGPTLDGLKTDWLMLQGARKKYDRK